MAKARARADLDEVERASVGTAGLISEVVGKIAGALREVGSATVLVLPGQLPTRDRDRLKKLAEGLISFGGKGGSE